MDVDLTTACLDREVGKALVRTAAFRKRVRELVAPIKPPDWDGLHLVLQDDPEDFVEVRKIALGRSGRVLTVAVGRPSALRLSPEDDAAFVDACAAQLGRAIRALELHEGTRQRILDSVETARVETREASRAKRDLPGLG